MRYILHLLSFLTFLACIETEIPESHNLANYITIEYYNDSSKSSKHIDTIYQSILSKDTSLISILKVDSIMLCNDEYNDCIDNDFRIFSAITNPSIFDAKLIIQGGFTALYGKSGNLFYLERKGNEVIKFQHIGGNLLGFFETEKDKHRKIVTHHYNLNDYYYTVYGHSWDGNRFVIDTTYSIKSGHLPL